MQNEILQNKHNTKDYNDEFEAFFSEVRPLRPCFIIKETKNSDHSLDDLLRKNSKNQELAVEGLSKDTTRKKIYKKIRKFDVEDIIFPIKERKNICKSLLLNLAHITFKTKRDPTEGLKRLDEYVFHGSKMNAKLLAKKDKYLEAMKSQQGKHDYEQNNDHYIDSCDSDSYKKQPDGY
ncbi:860_t:CDS:2 [Gigaspora margarita]|uniref:860_t:CDS:1 n=1 Tax=Gigaspora margarita TaxID=4874 RepID=A0ABN7VEQ2_GIGMA|nr:860_t:CDS:2 [Gigaspora margarita]